MGEIYINMGGKEGVYYLSKNKVVLISKGDPSKNNFFLKVYYSIKLLIIKIIYPKC